MSVQISDIRISELRFNTAALISDKPTTIALIPTRSTPTAKPGGGHDYFNTTPPETRGSQTFRVDLPGRGGPRRSPNDAGKVVDYDFSVIGLYDAVIEIGDTWDETATDGSTIHYHVDSVDPNNGYETVARGTVVATEPQHG